MIEVAPASDETALYRMFSASAELLYVGISCDIGARFTSHKNQKSWWTQVVRIDVEHFSSRKEALVAERAEIKARRPRWNIVHNRADEPTAIGYMARIYDERDRKVQILVEAGFAASDIRRGLYTSPANVYKSLERLIAADRIAILPPMQPDGKLRNRPWEEVQQLAGDILIAAGMTPLDPASPELRCAG